MYKIKGDLWTAYNSLHHPQGVNRGIGRLCQLEGHESSMLCLNVKGSVIVAFSLGCVARTQSHLFTVRIDSLRQLSLCLSPSLFTPTGADCIRVEKGVETF